MQQGKEQFAEAVRQRYLDKTRSLR